MSQHKTPDWGIPNNPLILHHSLPQSSLASETPCTGASGSGSPPEPPRCRPPTSGEFWSNREPNKEPVEAMEAIPIPNDLLVVNPRRRNGLILYKRYHAEFAGPGAAVGGVFDRDSQQALPLGNLLLSCPESANGRQQAYKIRLGWIRLIQQIADNPLPLQRAQLLFNQFEGFFDATTIAQLPDEALALLVGVFPQTIRTARMMHL